MRDRFAVWDKGSGSIVHLWQLLWTWDQAANKGGYFGLAGRQILKNIGKGKGLK